MKQKKTTYFSLFFLLCFITSFTTSTLQNFNLKKSQSTTLQSKLIKLSNKEDSQSGSNDILLEESENETEDVCVPTLFALPYLISFVQQQLSISKVISSTFGFIESDEFMELTFLI